MEESKPRTLYVGNLSHGVNEQLLCTLFSSTGPIQSCKIIREPNCDPYAFVEYETHLNACMALSAMNKRKLFEREIKVNWATSPGTQNKMDTSNHYHVFVGDLSPDIESDTLRKAFAPFGEITNCKIVRDSQTMKPKGYAFVSFVHKHEAEQAISSMNGQWLGMRPIRTNWSTRKPGTQPTKEKSLIQSTSFDDVYNQSSPTNCTVYCGGFLTNTLNEEIILRAFYPFGQIQDVRVFRDKGYAFVRFVNKESATKAIEVVNNSEIAGQLVKCHWGKEGGFVPNMNGISNGNGTCTLLGSGGGSSATIVNSGPSQSTAAVLAAAAAAANCQLDPAAAAALVNGQLVVSGTPVNGSLGGSQPYSYGYATTTQQQTQTHSQQSHQQQNAAATAAALSLMNASQAQSPAASIWYPPHPSTSYLNYCQQTAGYGAAAPPPPQQYTFSTTAPSPTAAASSSPVAAAAAAAAAAASFSQHHNHPYYMQWAPTAAMQPSAAVAAAAAANASLQSSPLLYSIPQYQTQ